MTKADLMEHWDEIVTDPRLGMSRERMRSPNIHETESRLLLQMGITVAGPGQDDTVVSAEMSAVIFSTVSGLLIK